MALEGAERSLLWRDLKIEKTTATCADVKRYLDAGPQIPGASVRWPAVL